MEEIFAVILVSNGDVLLEVMRLNVFYQSIMGFCHSVPNLKRRPAILEGSLTVQPCCSINRIRYFSLKNADRSIKEEHQMKGRKRNRNLKESYLVQEFDEDVQHGGIPNRILVHLRLGYHVVGNRNEVFEIFKFHFPKGPNVKQLGREVVLDMVAIRGPKTQINENERNKETETKKTKK